MKKQLTSIAICMVLVLTFVLMPITKVKADTTTNITVSADSRVITAYPDTNFGSSAYIDVGNNWDGVTEERAWLKFSLSSLPSEIFISTAKIWVRTYTVLIGSPSVSVRFSSTDSWNEGTITWNNQPSFSSAIAATTITAMQTWYSWSVTEEIQTEYSGDKTASFVLTDNTYATHAGVCSKEYGSYDPYLEVTYSSTPLPHGLIDSDMVETDKLKLSALLYHDGLENDPDYDFYAVKATLEDKAYKNAPDIGPMFVVVTVEMSDFCEEVPSNHKPEAGNQGKVSTPITYSFYFISFNLQIPSYWVDYTESHEEGLYKIEWFLKPSPLGLTVSGFLFKDYAEFAVGVRVPQGSKPYATVYAECVWFRKTWLIRNWWLTYAYGEVGWAVVDPPGANPITPTAPPTMDTPKTLYTFQCFSLREQGRYRPSYNPDIRFLKPSSSVLRIDSYQAGASSIGEGWAFVVVPRDWLNGKYLRFSWSGYFSSPNARVVAGAYIYDGEYDRANDTDFPEGAGIPNKGAGKLQTLATKNTAYGSWGPETVDVQANVAAGTRSMCTIFLDMGDAWAGQTVYLDIDWFQINEGAGGAGRLYAETFDAGVVMERTGTYGDYGYISNGYISP